MVVEVVVVVLGVADVAVVVEVVVVVLGVADVAVVVVVVTAAVVVVAVTVVVVVHASSDIDPCEPTNITVLVAIESTQAAPHSVRAKDAAW